MYNLSMKTTSAEILVGYHLRRLGWSLATAESCTGGLIGHRLTNVPGSSEYYLGGVIAYANTVKISQLGVSSATLERFGAVSRETVLEMAAGVCQRLGAQIALSVSGIAGPGGGTAEKPVGLVWIGLSAPTVQQAWQYFWPGNRLQVKEQAAEQALTQLLSILQAM